MKLGLIGVGIVGNAFYEGMKHAFDVVRFDKFRTDLSDVTSIEEVVFATDGPIFVCVPTPMCEDGSCSIDNVTQVVEALALSMKETFYTGSKRVVVVKSTVPPGTVMYLNYLFGESLSVVFNPEFLTEANPVQDFKNQDRIFVGGSSEATQTVADIYSIAYPNVVIMQDNATATEMVKYVGNCFLATKVSFANEMYQICDKLGVDYNAVMNMATLDKRLGRSHWGVPGPDGHFGYGGSCFPKDVNALIAVAKNLGVNPTLLEAAWNKNLEMRPEKDWEEMKGRAVL